MPKLIMTHTSPNLTIGGLYKGIFRDVHGNPQPEQPYLVVRRATPEEYVESCISLGVSKEYMESLMREKGNSRYYYEIQTD